MKLHSSLIALTLTLGAATMALPAAADDHRGGHGERLQALDTNGDGNISRDEAEAARQAMFAQADANGDGSITEAEFTAAAEARAEERRANRQGRAFGRADANGDGVLTLDETGGRIDAMFERVDTDGDGLITEAEREAAKSAIQGRPGERRGGRRGPPAE
ncbi:MAG: calcium-binding protein [Pseudomonadota bacterium]